MKKRILCIAAALILVIPLLPLCVSALSPSTDVTDVYKSSRFYERLCAVELTGDQRRDILNVAISQLGYHEGNSKADFGGDNWGGTNNYVEYNYGNRNTYSNNNTYSYYWCASFVTWCARQAKIPTSVVMNSVSCDKFVDDYISKSRYHTRASGYEPVAGDLIFYLTAGADRRHASHIGIVVGIDSNNVYTIEGNTSRGLVNYRSYAKTNTYIVGYAEPAYTGVKGDYSDYPHANGYIEPGYYTVTATSLNMRSAATTSSSVITGVPNGEDLYITEASGDWGKTEYGGKSGWVYLTYVQPSGKVRYTVNFDCGESDTSVDPISILPGETVVLPTKAPVIRGMIFLGWSKTKDAVKAEYAPGGKLTLDGDLTLFAVFEKKKITVEFYDYDGKLLEKTVYNYGDKVKEADHPTRPSDGEFDYSFKEWDLWFDDEAIMNRKYTAVYEAIPITATVSDTVRKDPSDSDIQVVATADPDGDVNGSGCGGFSAAQSLLLTLTCGAGIAFALKKRLG